MLTRTLPLLALIAIPAVAQVEVPKVSEIIEIRVVELDVIVTDRDGNRVGGLTGEDFEILEDGKPQTITNFSEITSRESVTTPKESVAPALDEPRRFVIFVDTLTTHPFQRGRLTRALEEFLEANLRPHDEAMLVSWSRHLKIVVPPTNNVSHLAGGLKQVARETSVEPGSAYWYEQVLTSAEERRRARAHARALANDVNHMARAVNAVLTRVAGVSGRKVLILATEGLAMLPGLELLDAASAGDESEARNYLESEELHSGPLIQSIARTANAAGVTVYAIHAAGLTSGMSVTSSSPEASRARERSVSNSVESLSLIANSTGGLVASNSNDFSAALTNVQHDLSSYYSIGYRTSSQRVDRERKLEVRTRNRQYTVRVRRSFVERSLDAELRDQVVANLSFPLSSNEMGIAAAPGKVSTVRKNRLSVPIDVRIPMSSLAFTSEGDAYVADIALFIASSDERGTLSAVQQLKHRIRVPRSEFGKVAAKHYTYGIDLDLKSTSRGNRVSLAVLDTLSRATGFAVVTVTKP